jgi:hypothetical protein
VYGNRGCLHDETGRIRRGFNGRRWIACRLQFKDRRRSPLLQRGRYTELFFLDEATALAAGHRPCAECRWDDYNRFLALWRTIHAGAAGADDIDEQLHAERLDGRARRLHPARLDDLPDGAFVLHAGEPHVVSARRLLRWSPAGYDDAGLRPTGDAQVITPRSVVGVLGSGWSSSLPLIHPSGRQPFAPATRRA